MHDGDLEPLDPSYLPGEPRPSAGTDPVPRSRAKAMALTIGLCALVLLTLLIVAGSRLRSARDERDALAGRLDRAQARTAGLNRETDELRRRTHLPGIDPEDSTVVVLPAAQGVSAVLSVLIAPEDFSPVWLRLDVVGATPGTMHALSSGSCTPNSGPLPHDLASAPAAPDGSVTVLAGPLSLDPDDPDIWVRLHRGDEEFGGVRGPLNAPRALRPNQPNC